MNATKAEVLKRYPTAYRQRRPEFAAGSYSCSYTYYILVRSKGGIISQLGVGGSSAAAWGAALVHCLAEALTK